MRTQWGSPRAEVEGRSAGLSSTIKGREDKVARRELRAPIDGVVNRVLITTLGGLSSLTSRSSSAPMRTTSCTTASSSL